MSSYHLKEKASGSNLFIPSEKTKNYSALNDNGNITNKGAIKKINTKAQIEKELAEVEAIKNQLQEEKRQADGLPSTRDSAQGAIIREATKLANQIVKERDALAQKTTTGKIYSRLDPGNDVIANRKEKVTAGLWSGNSGELLKFHT